jgi:hypothetical protein
MTEQSNRNKAQVMHKVSNDIDDGVHIYDTCVYFEDARLSPPGAHCDSIYPAEAFVISRENATMLWRCSNH